MLAFNSEASWFKYFFSFCRLWFVNVFHVILNTSPPFSILPFSSIWNVAVLKLCPVLCRVSLNRGISTQLPGFPLYLLTLGSL